MSQKKVANVERRTWDVEAYEKKAAARRQNEEAIDEQNETPSTLDVKAEFRQAPAGAVGPEGSRRAFLQARASKVNDIDERVGATTMISVENATSSSAVASDTSVKKTGVGWHCTVCDCFLKDSLTYLDHINGRKHQRKLGFSMRVERSTEADLMAKLNELEQTASRLVDLNGTSPWSLDDMVKQKDEQEQRRKEERQRKRKERKRLAKGFKEGTTGESPPDELSGADRAEPNNKQSVADEAEEEEDDSGGQDPAMAAMMGFSGFGRGHKNR